MGERVSITFFCDRCKVTIPKTKQPMRVIASEEGEWAMKWKVEWYHLCEKCRDDVLTFFKEK